MRELLAKLIFPSSLFFCSQMAAIRFRSRVAASAPRVRAQVFLHPGTCLIGVAGRCQDHGGIVGLLREDTAGGGEE
jgi:hypothetical protein